MKRLRNVVILSLCVAFCAVGLLGCVPRNDTTSSSSMMEATPTPTMSPSPSPSMSPSPSPSMSPSPIPENTMTGSEPVAATGSADLSKIGALSRQNVTWGPGTRFDGENRPTAPIELQNRFGGSYDCMFIGEKTDKTIYLTFDQGYENGYTTKILDTLKEKNVPAVFFLTGHYMNTSSDLIDRMVSEGHTLGNHSNKHLDSTEVPLDAEQQDIISLHEMIVSNYNYTPTLYRFPEGKFSEQSLALVESLGYKSVFWSFAYNDWDPNNQPEPGAALDKLVSRLHNGAIYLLHSVSKTNADILGDFIDSARAEGYEFKTME